MNICLPFQCIPGTTKYVCDFSDGRAIISVAYQILISQVDHQKVVELCSATNFSSNITELLQMHDTIQM